MGQSASTRGSCSGLPSNAKSIVSSPSPTARDFQRVFIETVIDQRAGCVVKLVRALETAVAEEGKDLHHTGVTRITFE